MGNCLCTKKRERGGDGNRRDEMGSEAEGLVEGANKVPAAKTVEQKEFKVDERIKKGLHVNPDHQDNKNYATLAFIQEDVIAKDAEGNFVAPGGVPIKMDENIKQGPRSPYYAIRAIRGEFMPLDTADGGKDNFKVDERIKKGLLVNPDHPDNKNYATLAFIRDDALPKDAEGAAPPLGAANAGDQFRVDEKIKKGLHVFADHPDNKNYATLAFIRDDSVLPKDNDAAKPAEEAKNKSQQQPDFKVDERIKKGRHVANNQNYATLGCLQGDDVLLPKDTDGPGPGKATPGGVATNAGSKGDFKVDERIKKGRHVDNNQNYATLGCLQGDDVLLPKDTDGPGPGKAAPGGVDANTGGKADFKVDERIKKGRHVENNQNYATLGCLQGDDVLLPKDAEGPGPGKAGPGGVAPGGVAANAGAKPDFKVDDRIKKGRHVDPAAQNNQNYATLGCLQGDDVLLPKDAEGPGPGKAALGGVAANAGSKGDFKVDDRIKKGRHVAAQNNQNYATLAGIQDIAKDA